MTAKNRKPDSIGNPRTKPAAGAEKSVSKPKNASVRAPAQSASSPNANKQGRCLDLLARGDGAVLSELVAATDWQPHTVRGFLSGIVKKNLSLTLHVSSDDDGTRRYRIDRNGRSRR